MSIFNIFKRSKPKTLNHEYVSDVDVSDGNLVVTRHGGELTPAHREVYLVLPDGRAIFSQVGLTRVPDGAAKQVDSMPELVRSPATSDPSQPGELLYYIDQSQMVGYVRLEDGTTIKTDVIGGAK